MESKQTIAVKIISPAATLKSISVGETRVIRSRDIKENIVLLPVDWQNTDIHSIHVCVRKEFQ